MNKLLVTALLASLFFNCSDQPAKDELEVAEVLIEEDVYVVDSVDPSTEFFSAALNSFDQGYFSEAADHLDYGIQALMTQGVQLQGDDHTQFKARIEELEDLSSRLREERVTITRIEIEELISEAQLQVAREYLLDLVTVTEFEPLPEFYAPGLEAAARSIRSAEAHLREETKEEAQKLADESRELAERLRAGEHPPESDYVKHHKKMEDFLRKVRF